MKRKSNLVVAALALMAVGAADAALTPTTTPGNSSLMFVAADTAPNPIDGNYNVSLSIDLGNLFADYVSGPFAFTTGALTAPGTTVVWDFANNTRMTNGTQDSGTFSWSSAYSSFKSLVAGIAGDSMLWGVIAGDTATGTTASASNLISNQNLLLTPTAALSGITAANVATGAANLNNMLIQSNGLGSQVAGTTGANTATSGGAFLGQINKESFGGQLQGGSYLNAVGATSTLTWLHQAATPNVMTLGQFTFDGTTDTLTYIVPVPEPGTLSLALAGLGALGFVGRRRKG